MLRACALSDGPKWGQHLPLVEFSYNNSYQESIKMSLFEALYGWPCRTLLSWSESGKQVIFGPDIVTEAEEKVRQSCTNILTAQSRQKSYTDKRHHPLEFEVGNQVYLWVSPIKGVHRFGIKGKLAPHYIGPYPIIDKYGLTSYQVDPYLPTQRMSKTFDWCGCQRHHSIGTWLDLQGPSHQDSRPTRLSHTQQDYSVQ
jgi:hypothetical protein